MRKVLLIITAILLSSSLSACGADRSISKVNDGEPNDFLTDKGSKDTDDDAFPSVSDYSPDEEEPVETSGSNKVVHELPIDEDFENGEEEMLFWSDDLDVKIADEESSIVEDGHNDGHAFCVRSDEIDREVFKHLVVINGIDMEEGKFYEYSFCTIGTAESNVAFEASRDIPDDWSSVGVYKEIELTDEWNCQEGVFKAVGVEGVDKEDLRLVFHVGQAEDFCLDDFYFDEVVFDDIQSILKNGSFEKDIAYWETEDHLTEAALAVEEDDDCIDGSACLHVDAKENPDREAYQVQVCQNLEEIENNRDYYISFQAKSENDNLVVVEISSRTHQGYGVYEEFEVKAGDWGQKPYNGFGKVFNGNLDDEKIYDARVCLSFGLTEGKMKIDDFQVK